MANLKIRIEIETDGRRPPEEFYGMAMEALNKHIEQTLDTIVDGWTYQYPMIKKAYISQIAGN